MLRTMVISHGYKELARFGKVPVDMTQVVVKRTAREKTIVHDHDGWHAVAKNTTNSGREGGRDPSTNADAAELNIDILDRHRGAVSARQLG